MNDAKEDRHILSFIGDVVGIEKGTSIDSAPAPDVISITGGMNCLARVGVYGGQARSFYGKRVRVTIEEV